MQLLYYLYIKVSLFSFSFFLALYNFFVFFLCFLSFTSHLSLPLGIFNDREVGCYQLVIMACLGGYCTYQGAPCTGPCIVEVAWNHPFCSITSIVMVSIMIFNQNQYSLFLVKVTKQTVSLPNKIK